ncbi:helix-turn-helix domain-containing protein [Synechococcus sp. WH 8020]
MFTLKQMAARLGLHRMTLTRRLTRG